ncbi:MAG: VOC family protein [Pseudomonadota bacterium]
MPAPTFSGLDHVVLTVTSIETSVHFYSRVLGMDFEVFTGADGTRRHSLRFGGAKINLHEAGREHEPKAQRPTPGSGDLCLLTETPIEDWLEHLARKGVEPEAGPVPRTGARGQVVSLYLRDPDRNLIEIACYAETDVQQAAG